MATVVNFKPKTLAFPSHKPPVPRSFARSLPSIRRSKAIGPSSSSSSSSSLIVRSSSSSSNFVNGSKVDALGDISVMGASSGEPMFFRDLWDQNEGTCRKAEIARCAFRSGLPTTGQQ